jgi:hypothetical protein
MREWKRSDGEVGQAGRKKALQQSRRGLGTVTYWLQEREAWTRAATRSGKTLVQERRQEIDDSTHSAARNDAASLSDAWDSDETETCAEALKRASADNEPLVQPAVAAKE